MKKLLALSVLGAFLVAGQVFAAGPTPEELQEAKAKLRKTGKTGESADPNCLRANSRRGAKQGEGGGGSKEVKPGTDAKTGG